MKRVLREIFRYIGINLCLFMIMFLARGGDLGILDLIIVVILSLITDNWIEED